MRLTSKGRYAVRAILDLAFCSNGRPVTICEISERQSIPRAYLQQIFRLLRNGSIVNAVKGPGGGYILARPMDEISIKDILVSVVENINPVRDIAGEGSLMSDTIEFILARTHFENLGALMCGYLSETSIGDQVRKARDHVVIQGVSTFPEISRDVLSVKSTISSAGKRSLLD